MIASVIIHAQLEALLRKDRGRLLAALGSYLGNYTLAEDALQEAMSAALTAWAKGIPDNPQGWLLQVSRRKALDVMRKSSRHDLLLGQLTVFEAPDQGDRYDIPDDRLRLILTCCHPALEQSAQVALTLRALGGLTTEEVARAFMVKPAAMGQRISRAKAKIKGANIPFAVSDLSDMQPRMKAVLQVIYLIYNEGYAATQGPQQLRTDLCDEALFLARLVSKLSPDNTEAQGLLALICFSHARRGARLQTSDGFAPLIDQDRSLWDHPMIAEGKTLLEMTLPKGQVGPYQLQAAIHALHCEALDALHTDWAQIASLYILLLQMLPTDVVRLNYAVALSFSGAAGQALSVLDKIAPQMQDYQPFHAAHAEILMRLGQKHAAVDAYNCAIDLSQIAAERLFLQHRRAACVSESSNGADTRIRG